jgi:hypothetical protein
MVFFALASLLSLLVDLATLRFRSERTKKLEILLLRRQIAILRRAQARPVRSIRWRSWAWPASCGRCRPRLARAGGLQLFSPETVLRRHRELVSRKWTFRRRRVPGTGYRADSRSPPSLRR